MYNVYTLLRKYLIQKRARSCILSILIVCIGGLATVKSVLYSISFSTFWTVHEEKDSRAESNTVKRGWVGAVKK